MYELIILGSTFLVAVVISFAKIVYDSVSQESGTQIQYLNSNPVSCYEAGLFVSSGLNLGENITSRLRNYASSMLENTSTAATNPEEALISIRSLQEVKRINESVATPNISQDKHIRNETSTSKVNAMATHLIDGEMSESPIPVERNGNYPISKTNISEITTSGEISLSISSGAEQITNQNATIKEHAFDHKCNSDCKVNLGARNVTDNEIKVSIASSSSENSQYTTSDNNFPVVNIPSNKLTTSVKTFNSATPNIGGATEIKHETSKAVNNNSNLKTSHKAVTFKRKKLKSEQKHKVFASKSPDTAKNVDTTSVHPNQCVRIDSVSTSEVQNSFSNRSLLNRNKWADGLYLSDMCKIPNISENIDVESEEKCLIKNADLEIKILNTMYVPSDEQSSLDEEEYFSCEESDNSDFDDAKCVMRPVNTLSCNDRQSDFAGKVEGENFSACNLAHVDSTTINGSTGTDQGSIKAPEILGKINDMDKKINDLTKRLDFSIYKKQQAKVSENLTSMLPTFDFYVDNAGNICSTPDCQLISTEDCVPNKDFEITNTAIKKTCSFQNALSLNDMSKEANSDDLSKNSRHFTTDNHRSRLTNVLASTGAISKIQHSNHSAKGINYFSSYKDKNTSNRHCNHDDRKINCDGDFQIQENPQNSSIYLPSTSAVIENIADIEHGISTEGSKDLEQTAVKNSILDSKDFFKHGKPGLKNMKKWFTFSMKKFKGPGHAVQVQNEACMNTSNSLSNSATSPETVEEICADLLQRIEKNNQMLNADLPHYPQENEPVEVQHNNKTSAALIMKKVYHFFKNLKPWTDPNISNAVPAMVSASNYDDEFLEIGEDSEDYFQYSDAEDHNPETRDIAVQSNPSDCTINSEVNLCKGCSTAPADALYFPCGHNYLCIECATTVLKFFKKCCICRKKIDSIQRFDA